MTRFTLFAFCLFWQSLTVYSQAPGYLGKKVFLGASISATPTFSGPSVARRAIASSEQFDLSTRFGIEVGYVTSRSKAIKISADYFKTGLLVSAETPSILKFENPDYHTLFYHLVGYTIDFGFQKYRVSKEQLRLWVDI
jgi:hypothetical protein